jgi:hypothetical protein
LSEPAHETGCEEAGVALGFVNGLAPGLRGTLLNGL